MHSGTCARDGKTIYDGETGADKLNELQAVWPAEECWRLNCHAQSYVWLSLDQKKLTKNSYLVENAAIYMEGNQQTQSQGATKQAMIYICGGKRKSKLKSHLFSESRRSFNYLTAQRAGQRNTCKYNAWSCIFFHVVHGILINHIADYWIKIHATH